MTIISRDQLIKALGNNSSRFIIDKASIASQTAGSFVSLWRATGQPGQGAIPTTAAVVNNTTLGTMNFAQQSGDMKSYIGYFSVAAGNATTTVEIHDRLMHMGGLSGTVTAAQTVNLDLSTNLSNSNLAERIGDADYSDVNWWLEWYAATGSTASNATVNVTYNDDTTGSLTAIALAATRPASHMISLNTLVPSGKFIRAVNSVTLSASTGSAGNFGVTATRIRADLAAFVANLKFSANWADLGLPEIKNSSGLFPIVLTATTSSGTVRGGGKIIHG